MLSHRYFLFRGKQCAIAIQDFFKVLPWNSTYMLQISIWRQASNRQSRQLKGAKLVVMVSWKVRNSQHDLIWLQASLIQSYLRATPNTINLKCFRWCVQSGNKLGCLPTSADLLKKANMFTFYISNSCQLYEPVGGVKTNILDLGTNRWTLTWKFGHNSLPYLAMRYKPPLSDHQDWGHSSKWVLTIGGCPFL